MVYKTENSLRNFDQKAFICVIQSCTDVDECSYSDVCGPRSTCQNTVGSFQCVCDTGFVANANGTGCVGEFSFAFCSQFIRLEAS